MAKIYCLGGENVVKRDVLGNPMPQEPSGLGAFVDLFNSKTPIFNPLVNELARLNSVDQNSTPGKLTKNQTIQGQKMALTPTQLDNLETQVGPKVTQDLTNLVTSPGYQQLSDEDKANAIGSVVEQARKVVRTTTNVNTPGDTTKNISTDTTPISNGYITKTDQGFKYSYVDTDTGSPKNISIDKQPAKTDKMAYAKWERDAYDKAQTILNIKNLPDSEKTNLIKSIGLDPVDVEYYDLANQDNYLKTIWVKETLGNISDHGQFLQKLVELRQKSTNDKEVLSSGVIDDLVDDGTLTKEEGAYLKKVSWSKQDGKAKVKITGRGAGAKIKNVKFVPLDILKNTKQPAATTPVSLETPNVDFSVPSLQIKNVTVPQAPKFQVKFNL